MKILKVLFSIALGLVLVYWYWSDEINFMLDPEPFELVDTDTGDVLLYSDEEYNLAFNVEGGCSDDFKILESEVLDGELKRFDVKGMVGDGSFVPWFSYLVYSREDYDAIDPLSVPGKPAYVYSDDENVVGYFSEWPLPRGLVSLCGIGGIDVGALSLEV